MNRTSPDMRENTRGVWVSGATGTRYSLRGLGDGLAAAYNGNADLIPSSLLSSDPPRDRKLAGILRANSGGPVDLYVHSSAPRQLERAISKVGRDGVDMRNMTVIALDIPTGPSNLKEGLRLLGGEARRAIDSVVAFPPDPSKISLAEATEGLRLAFPDWRQDGEGLVEVNYQTGEQAPVDYSSSLDDKTRQAVEDLDDQIGAALTDRHLPAAQHMSAPVDLFVQRGDLLNDGIESIYHGDNSALRPPNKSKGERKAHPLVDLVRSVVPSARILPAVISGSGWRLMGELSKQHEAGTGPRVIFVLPEWPVFNSKDDVEAIDPNAVLDQRIVSLSGTTHSTVAFRPFQVISGIKGHIDSLAA